MNTVFPDLGHITTMLDADCPSRFPDWGQLIFFAPDRSGAGVLATVNSNLFRTPRENGCISDRDIREVAALFARVCNMLAGIDGLQGSGTVVVFAELDWSPAVHAQCEDRLHRIGMDESMESLLAYYLVCDAGSDDTILTTLGLKVGQFVGIMGDDGETAEQKKDAIAQAEKHMASIVQRLKMKSTSGGRRPRKEAS